MAALQQHSPDPAVKPPPVSSPNMDWEAHVRTYNGFLNLVKWFTIHMALLVVGLYFFIIGDNGTAGTVFVVLAVGALIFGLFLNPKLRQDVSSATTGGPMAD